MTRFPLLPVNFRLHPKHWQKQKKHRQPLLPHLRKNRKKKLLNNNDRQKLHMAHRVTAYFDQQGGVSGRTLALWGLAFKANTDDMRESASLAIINYLTDRGMRVRAFDPEAGPNAAKLLKRNSLVEIVPSQYAALDGADALLIATEWNQFRTPDFARIKAKLSAPVIFDGRNLYSGKALARQGFAYFSVGCR